MRSLLPSLRPSIFTSTFGGFGLGDRLWDVAGLRPSLDLQLATRKSLVDAVTGASLVTHTRASSATFVDSTGVLRSAVTNLLLRSEEFGTTWGATNASLAANTATAPNGTVTADTLIEDSTTGGHVVVQSISGAPDNTSFTSSCYCKAFTRSWVAVTVVGKDGSINRVWFNLANGSQGTTNGTVTNFSVVNVGDGWYRIAVTASSATGGGNLQIRISLASADNASSYTGDGTSGIYLWGAQLEQSATVGEYIPTTSTINSAPRFDHNPTTGESLGLLVEEQRTNLLLQSEEFDDVSWIGGSSVMTANTQVAPNGTTTADTLTATSGVPNFYQTVTCTASTAYTFSFYVKLGTMPASDFRFAVRDDTAGAFIAVDIVPNVTPVTTEWRRVTYTVTTPVGCLLLRVYPYRFTIITGGTAFLWGAQLEASTFPTSYIPTTTAAVTRSADVASSTGSAFSSWYRQDEGTVFAEFQPRANATAGVVYLNAGSVAEATRIFYNSATSNYTFSVRAASVEQSSIILGAYVLQSERISAAYKVNDLAASRNGGASVSDVSATLPTGIDRLNLGTNQAANYLNGTIRRLTYWPQRLNNEVLQRITQ
jgi:hypothetical protein